ncbi:transposase family protein [Ktedonospora formicarum]|uniref:transposase family protein n=1 Tax=Ktedonospora formicarum TaxID=2778364 RepID=UPI001C68E393
MKRAILIYLSLILQWHFDRSTSDKLAFKGRYIAPLACCPLCTAASEYIHSHYLRTVADIPEIGQLAILKLTVHRFFCRNAFCPRRIFTERLPELVQP